MSKSRSSAIHPETALKSDEAAGLGRVIAAWPLLPAYVRLAILAAASAPGPSLLASVHGMCTVFCVKPCKSTAFVGSMESLKC
jgi:hypothetical protein